MQINLHILHDYILNQIIGTKTIYLFHYKDNPSLKMHSFLSKNNNFIKQNFFNLNHSQLKLYKVTLQPGDSLMIPPWWFHAVHGHQFSCSITKVYQRNNYKYLQSYKYLKFLHILGNTNTYLLSISCITLLIIAYLIILIVFKK